MLRLERGWLGRHGEDDVREEVEIGDGGGKTGAGGRRKLDDAAAWQSAGGG